MENLEVMVILFMMVILGYALCKLGYMGDKFDKKLSSIVVDVTCPLLILSSVMRGVGDAVIPALITMVFTCGVRLLYLWGYVFSHNSNVTIAIIYPISWALTSIAFLIYYKSRKWMPKGFHF